ncbi:MAG: Gfo/Idh/MocA family oxidoreductase [bacterium]|nr:Gfo/Idh/MocA family oxidoreductase [bacterium]MBU1919001.1 Gfo/Idh/MocA family oxidoreductase [bacterium]
MTNKVLKLGVIGVGVMGYNHVRVIRDSEDADIIAVCDPSQDNLNKIKHFFKVENTYQDITHFLTKEKLDGVIISSPSTTHFDIAKLVIEQKIPLLVEKPLALDQEQAKTLVALASNNKVPMMVGYVERCNPVTLFAKNIIQNGNCGPVKHINIVRIGPFPKRMAIHRDGVVADLSTHDIDLLQYMTGHKINRLFSSLRYDDKQDMYARTLFEMDNDISASCEWSWISPFRKRSFEIVCDMGTLIGDLTEQHLYYYRNPIMTNPDIILENDFLRALKYSGLENEVTKYVIQKEEPLKQELKEFIRIIRENELTDCHFAVDVLNIMNCIYQSFENKTSIDII